ncbi:MAG: GtrA family protein [Lachnospiraceae bacterium]|nr:GtrA family protein [Candidatus Colinaster scatohippi]
MKKIWEIYKKYREGIDYLFWGGAAFVLSMVLFWVFTTDKLGLQWSEVLANNVDWIICVIFAFFTNKIFVFRSKAGSINGLIKEFIEFVIARLFTLVLEDVIIWVLCKKCGWSSDILTLCAKLIGQFVVIVTNYVLSKLWIFRKKKPVGEKVDKEA